MLNKYISHLTSVAYLPNLLFSSQAQIKVQIPKTDTHLLPEGVVPTETTTSREELLQLFKQMQTVRCLETTCDQLFKNGEIKGFCHLYDGEEAVATGIESALTMEDCFITTYRCHGHAFTRGTSLFKILSEALGKATGTSKGKGGSMHLYNAANHFYGGIAIIGAQIPLGAGFAFALQYLNKKNISVCMYGDGAANQGQIFETINMAKLWNLPLCFCIENNRYAMGTSSVRSTKHQKYYARDELIPGLHADGMNVFQMREVMKYAKKYILEGNGPIFVEADTYRYHGHSTRDPDISYRTLEEKQEVRRKRDPIANLKHIMLDSNACTKQEIEIMEQNIQDEMATAVKDARAAPYPTDLQMREDIYADDASQFIRYVEYDQSQFPNGKL